MKTAAIISCSDSYDYGTRTKYVAEYLEKHGYKVTFLVSNFDHRNKSEYFANHEGSIRYIKVRPYKKNISVSRILSHLDFAEGVAKHIKNNEYDLVYHCAPPNATIRKLSQLKKKCSFRLITEVGDMWPESMPVGSQIKKALFLPFKVWSNLRDKYLFNSDFVIAECDLFRDAIVKNTGLQNVETMYFCKEANYIDADNCPPLEKQINLCYLGSINNIIDYRIIALLVSALVKKVPVEVHIIGDGEKRDAMISCLQEAGGKITFHGKVFDDLKKKEIMSNCHFALNVMNENVVVGMTMKSLDYFSFGIPLINNIGADIGEMVENNNIGYNIDYSNYENIAKELCQLNMEEYLAIRACVQQFHRHYFGIQSFENSMKNIMGERKNEESVSVQ